MRADLLALGAVGALALAGARGSRAKIGPPKVLPPEKRGPVPEEILPAGTRLSYTLTNMLTHPYNQASSEPYLPQNMGYFPPPARVIGEAAEDWPLLNEPQHVELPRDAKIVVFSHPSGMAGPEMTSVYKSLTGVGFSRGQKKPYRLFQALHAAGYDGYQETGWDGFQKVHLFRHLDLPRLRRTLSGKRFMARPEAEPW